MSPMSTDVRTTARQAFDLKAGVCQDFSHVMIAGPARARHPGRLCQRLPAHHSAARARNGWKALMRCTLGCASGADAKPAGRNSTRPTPWLPATIILLSATAATMPMCRPIVGVLKTSGSQEGKQSVDVIPLE